MTGHELKAIRQSLRLTARQFALELGYKGNNNTNCVLIYQMEKGQKPIPDARAYEARLLLLTNAYQK